MTTETRPILPNGTEVELQALSTLGDVAVDRDNRVVRVGFGPGQPQIILSDAEHVAAQVSELLAAPIAAIDDTREAVVGDRIRAEAAAAAAGLTVADSQSGEITDPNFFADADMSGWRPLWQTVGDIPIDVTVDHRARKFTDTHANCRTPFPDDEVAVGASFYFSIRLDKSTHVSGDANVVRVLQVDASGGHVGADVDYIYFSTASTSTTQVLSHSGTRADGAVAFYAEILSNGNAGNSVTLSQADLHRGTSPVYRARSRTHFTTPADVQQVREQVQGGVANLLAIGSTRPGFLLNPVTGLPDDVNVNFTVLNPVVTYPGEPMVANKNLFNAAWLDKEGNRLFGIGFGGGSDFALPAGTSWPTPDHCWTFVADAQTVDLATMIWVRGETIPDVVLPAVTSVDPAGATAIAAQVLDDALITRTNRFDKHALDVAPGKLMTAATGLPGDSYAQFTMTGWMDCRSGKAIAPSCDCLNVAYASPDGSIVASQEYGGSVNNPGMAASLFTATTTSGSPTMIVTAIVAGVMPYYTQPLFGAGIPANAQVGAGVTMPSRGVFSVPIWVAGAPANATATSPVGGSAIRGGRAFLPPARATKFRTTIETGKVDTATFSEGLYTAPYKSFGLAAQPTAAMAALGLGMHADSLGDFGRKQSEGGNGGFGDDLPALAGSPDWKYYFAAFGQKTGDDNVQLTATALANVDVMILERIANDSGKGNSGAPSPMGSPTDAPYLGDAPAPTGTTFYSRTKGEIERCLMAKRRIKLFGITNGIRIRRGQLAYANYADGPLDTSGWIDEWASNEPNPLGYTQFDYAKAKIESFRMYGFPCLDLASEAGESFLNAGDFSSDGVHKLRAWNTFRVNPRIVAELNVLAGK